MQARAALSERDFANAGGAQSGIRSTDARQYQRSFDSRQQADLNRSYGARTNGYQRYNSRQAYGGGSVRAMPRRRR